MKNMPVLHQESSGPDTCITLLQKLPQLLRFSLDTQLHLVCHITALNSLTLHAFHLKKGKPDHLRPIRKSTSLHNSRTSARSARFKASLSRI